MLHAHVRCQSNLPLLTKLCTRNHQLTRLFRCRLRDLNDEINKLIREKGHWEKRIVELGGPDYALTRAKITDSEGHEVLGGASGKGSGYRCARGRWRVVCAAAAGGVRALPSRSVDCA